MKMAKRTKTPPTIVVWYTVWEMPGKYEGPFVRRAACQA